jgi:(1->4)-alpha-D-glucan 1-alpha-D-glucosylmutase
MSSPRELIATYRLQLGPGLDFAQARALVPYLQELGISHLYLSPSLQARKGSTHGYDVVDPTRLSEELGGEDEFRELARAGLGVILDIVPNHMGTGDENRWWADPETRERWFDLDPAGGYRRFFDIDDMAAIRQERDEVFETTHAKVLELVREGLLDGLRVDHPDGLADPAGYLRKLREAGVERVWVEKILSASQPPERLREWPVSGTVGYEFLNDACALFVDPRGRESLSELLEELTGESRSFAEIALEAQLEQVAGPFKREVARLVRLGKFDVESIGRALAGLPVYRTYVEAWSGLVEEADRTAIEQSGMASELARALLLESEHPVGQELVTRFQQTSPAIAAKGVEDTAFYRYLRLLCLNEVGGDPERFGLSVDDFHRANLERAERFPEGLLITQTHDTKRSGDARARLGVLSRIPGEWRERVLAWRAIGDRLRSGGAAPDRAEEYLIHQTLISVWPVERERLDAYLVKALREAKRNSSWMEVNEEWEEGVLEFTHQLLDSQEFLDDFEPFAERVAVAGERSALSQLLLKLTSPGIPDIYQGDELWRLSLVDPDNRREVDWEERRRLLGDLGEGAAPGRATRKLHLIRVALELRRRQGEALAGSYTPLGAGERTCAYRRGEKLVVIVRIGGPEGARLDRPLSGRWRDVIGGGELVLEGEDSVDGLVDEAGLALLEWVGLE